MNILPAKKEHAPLIAKAITMAIGEELTSELAGEYHAAEDVNALFAGLAERDDTQYSYLNTLVAVDEKGNVAGLIVSYDGARLIEMRRIFFSEAARQLGMVLEGDVDSLPVETTPDEFYLDSLAVWPEYRGKGVARMLIDAAEQRARACGKPLGLLVDKTNARARRLYDAIGFVAIGERPFAGEMMDHMVRLLS